MEATCNSYVFSLNYDDHCTVKEGEFFVLLITKYIPKSL